MRPRLFFLLTFQQYFSMSDFPFKIKALSLYDRKMVEGYYVGPGQIMSGSMTLPFYPGTMSVFTGRRDVNGREIYTGDIVRVTTLMGGRVSENMAVCVYNEDDNAFELMSDSAAIGIAESVPMTIGAFRAHADRTFEVVGSKLDKKIKLYQQTGKS